MRFRVYGASCFWASIFVAALFRCVVLANDAQPGLLQLAHAYRETERSLEAFPFTSAQESVDCNRAMDRVALHFFTGSFSDAIHAMHDITLQRALPATSTLVDKGTASLELEVTPSDWVLGSKIEPQVRLTSLYRLEIKEQLDVTLDMKWTPQGGQPLAANPIHARLEPNQSLTMEIAASEVRQLLAQLGSQAATVDVELRAPSGYSVRQLPFNLLSESLEATAAAFKQRLQKCTATPNLSSENLGICVRRIALLESGANKDQISRWALGTVALKQAIGAELDLLEQGTSPYLDAIGDVWMSFVVNGTTIDCRVYRPTTADPGQTLPVVIALHGAGGNEHMFFETLGAGRIKKLAERYKFIAVSPATVPLLTNQQLFPAFVDELAKFQSLDRKRVIVIGHSMGAFAATQLGSLFPDQISAMALIAGGPRWGLAKPQFPRTRVYLPQLDEIVPGAQIAKVVAGCARSGLPIDSQEVPDCGHVLAVSRVLDDAIAWTLGTPPSDLLDAH